MLANEAAALVLESKKAAEKKILDAINADMPKALSIILNRIREVAKNGQQEIYTHKFLMINDVPVGIKDLYKKLLIDKLRSLGFGASLERVHDTETYVEPNSFVGYSICISWYPKKTLKEKLKWILLAIAILTVALGIACLCNSTLKKHLVSMLPEKIVSTFSSMESTPSGPYH